ncbi:MAG: outer membrane protein transport protein [Flavobacteriaceae bacterium]|nr:outer membrane protein transport protein [Flavobacteriaceae bacterium]
MKKIILNIIALTAISGGIFAQTIEDVLRYSNENLVGSARFSAMSGAFGALGGDMSAVNINPAATAVFNNSIIHFSGNTYHNLNEALYKGNYRDKHQGNFTINQIGGALVFKAPNSSKKISIGFNYDRTNNFNNNVLIRGNAGSENGIDKFFLNQANGLSLYSISILNNQSAVDAYFDIGNDASLGSRGQAAFLGYYGGVINPVADTDENTQYTSNAQYNNLNQTYQEKSNGYTSSFTANMAAQLNEHFYIGAALNYRTLFFEKTTFHTESGFVTDKDHSVNRILYDTHLKTEGTGVSLSVGAIAKLNNIVRLGLSYQSPTWYFLQDEFSERIETNEGAEDDRIRDIDFNIINVYPEYIIRTPQTLTGSIGLIFGKQGLLSVDIAHKTMESAKLQNNSDWSDNSVFQEENNLIRSSLQNVNTIRVGGEYRIKALSLRAGFSYETSPYKNEITLGDKTGVSFGLGYNFGSFRLDAAYRGFQQSYNTELFPASTIASIENMKNNFTLGFNFQL